MESINILKPIKTKAKPIEKEVCEEEPLSPSSRLLHEPNFNVHILSIMATKSRINPQAIKHQWIPNFVNHPRFCSLMVQLDLSITTLFVQIFLDCICMKLSFTFDMPIYIGWL